MLGNGRSYRSSFCYCHELENCEGALGVGQGAVCPAVELQTALTHSVAQ